MAKVTDGDKGKGTEQKIERVSEVLDTSTEPLYGLDIDEIGLLAPLGKVPDPPKCIKDRLEREGKVWRWLSKPTVKQHGMRGYVTVSPDSREKDLITSGKDGSSAVHIDSENKICWREDAWLAAIPKRLYEARRQAVRERTKAQTEAAQRHMGYLRAIQQASGGAATGHVSVQQEYGPEEDLPPRP